MYTVTSRYGFACQMSGRYDVAKVCEWQQLLLRTCSSSGNLRGIFRNMLGRGAWTVVLLTLWVQYRPNLLSASKTHGHFLQHLNLPNLQNNLNNRISLSCPNLQLADAGNPWDEAVDSMKDMDPGGQLSKVVLRSSVFECKGASHNKDP